MPDPIRTDDQPHDEAEALLPWYATGQLDPAERATVERHLSSCGRCQRQLADEHRLIDEFQKLAPEVDSGWSKLRARIEPRPAWRPARALADGWRIARRPGVAMLAAAQFAFLLLAAGLLVSLSRPSYHALGSAPAPAAANIIVIFAPDTRESHMRSLLESSGASLAGGPTAADAYLLYVPASAQASALAKLRADREVRMAQPIGGATP